MPLVLENTHEGHIGGKTYQSRGSATKSTSTCLILVSFKVVLSHLLLILGGALLRLSRTEFDKGRPSGQLADTVRVPTAYCDRTLLQSDRMRSHRARNTCCFAAPSPAKFC